MITIHDYHINDYTPGFTKTTKQNDNEHASKIIGKSVVYVYEDINGLTYFDKEQDKEIFLGYDN